MTNLKTEVKRKSTPNLPKNERFLPRYSHLRVRLAIRNIRSSENFAFCLLVTSVLMLAIFPGYQENIIFKHSGKDNFQTSPTQPQPRWRLVKSLI